MSDLFLNRFGFGFSWLFLICRSFTALFEIPLQELFFLFGQASIAIPVIAFQQLPALLAHGLMLLRASLPPATLELPVWILRAALTLRLLPEAGRLVFPTAVLRGVSPVFLLSPALIDVWGSAVRACLLLILSLLSPALRALIMPFLLMGCNS
jgi:hypothetical protein